MVVRDTSLLEGSFVETAFTTDQVMEALAVQRKLGVGGEECAFLYGVPVSAEQHLQPKDVAYNERPDVKKRNHHLLLDDRKLWISQATLDAADLKTIRSTSLANLARWKSQGTWGPVYEEWWEIMTNASDAVVVHIMTSQSDEPNRLRQSMPYTGILDEETQRKIRVLYYAARAENDLA